MGYMEPISEYFSFHDLTIGEISRAFPLAQATGAAKTLTGWNGFALSLFQPNATGDHGIKVLANRHGTIVGLIVFAIDNDPLHGVVFEVTHLIAFDRMSAEALIEEAMRIAHERECATVRANVGIGDFWLSDFLRRHSFMPERQQLLRVVPPS